MKTTIKYKLTTQEGTTHEGYQWSMPKGKRPGKWHKTSGEGGLCSGGFLHYYHDPMLAVLLNPIHANIEDPVLWEVEVRGMEKDDNGLKGGASEMRLLRRIELPVFSTEQRVAFAIYCAQEVYKDEAFAKWAWAWLDGSDRSAWAAEAAAEAAEAVVAAAWAAAEAVVAWAAAACIDLIAMAKKAHSFKP